jgi:hypothetical protein
MLNLLEHLLELVLLGLYVRELTSLELAHVAEYHLVYVHETE